jgi:hypothetical protein
MVTLRLQILHQYYHGMSFFFIKKKNSNKSKNITGQIEGETVDPQLLRLYCIRKTMTGMGTYYRHGDTKPRAQYLDLANYIYHFPTYLRMRTLFSKASMATNSP